MPELSSRNEYSVDVNYLTHESPDDAPWAEDDLYATQPFRYCTLCGHRLARCNTGEQCLRHGSLQAPQRLRGRTYEGSPCKICGGTERYNSSGSCVACQRGRVLKTITFDGRPCGTCGRTLRYKTNHNCVHCARRRKK